MAARTRDELVELLEKSANALGAVAWLFAIAGLLAGAVAIDDIEGGADGSIAVVFVATSGSYLITAAGMMVARAVTMLALVTILGD